MLKKGKVLALILAFSMLFASVAYAAIPNNSVVIGNKAYSIDYLMEEANIPEINQAVAENGTNPIFYQLPGVAESWTDVMTSQPATPEQIAAWPEITYKDAQGNETQYGAGNGEPVSEQLTVESVSAINLKQVEIKFNKELDTTTAGDIANYEVYDNGSTTKMAGIFLTEISTDKKTVLLTLVNDATTKLTNLSNAKVVVKKAVKDAEGTAMTADYTKTDVAVSDAARPTVVSVEQTAPTKIKVAFSEPVKDNSNGLTIGTDNFKVDNGSYIVIAAGAPDLEKNTIELTLGGNLTAGDHTLTVNPVDASDLEDFAGFEVNKASQTSFTITADTVAPTASIKNISQSSVTFLFNEPVVNADDANVAYRHTVDATNYQVLGNNSNVTVNADKTEVIVNFSAAGFPLPQGNVTLYISYVSSTGTKILDNFGNSFVAASYTGTVVADTTKPTATVALVTGSSTQINITYSEAVTGATTASNYTLKDASNNTVAFTGPVLVSGNQYRITTTSAMSGTYKLTIANIKDTAVVPNTMDTMTATITVADSIKPQIADESYAADATPNFYTQADNKNIRIYFTEAMNITELQTLTMYQNVVDSNANPTSATAEADGKSVYLVFENAVTGNILVGQLSDASGNKMAALSTTLTFAPGSYVGLDSTITKNVVATNTTTVKMYLNDTLASLDVADFEVDIDGGANSWTNPASVIQTLENGKSVLTFTVAAIAKNQWNISKPQVRTSGDNPATDTKNAYGMAVDINLTNIADQVVPELVTTDALTTMDVDANGKIDHIKVTFTEVMDQAYVAADKFTVTGYTVTDAYPATAPPTNATDRTGAIVGDSEIVYVRVTEKATADTDATPTVTIATGMKDLDGNVYAGLATATASVDAAAPVLVSATYADVDSSNTVNKDDTLTLTFSEAVKIDIAAGAIATNDEIDGAFDGTVAFADVTADAAGAADSTATYTYVITLGTNPTCTVGVSTVDIGASIVANSIEDAAGNDLAANAVTVQ